MDRRTKRIIIVGAVVWIILLVIGFFRFAEWYAEEAFHEGLEAAEHNHFEEANALFLKAKKWQPRSWEIRDHLGWILMRKGLYEEAIKEYEGAIGIAPKNADLYKQIGFCNIHLDRQEEALSAFLKASEVNPSDLMSLELVAVTSEKLDDIDQAIAYWNKILALDPDYQKALERRSALLGEE